MNTADFWVTIDDRKIRKWAKQDLNELKRELEQYWTKGVPRDSYDLWYTIPLDSPLLSELAEIQKRFPNAIEIRTCRIKVSDYDITIPKAYIACFDRNRIDTYSDVDPEYTVCKACGKELEFLYSSLWDGKKYGHYYLAQNSGPIKKSSEKMSTFYYNTIEDLQIVSIALYKHLINNGVDDECFEEIKTKREKILAYRLKGKSRIPSCGLVGGNYTFEKTCKECNRNLYKWNRHAYKYEPFILSPEVKLKDFDVLESTDLYSGERLILVSPRIRNIIIEQDKNAYFEPVY